MNKIKFLLNVAIIPVYFAMLVVVGIKDAFYSAYWEVVDGYRATKRIYGIK